MRIPLVVLASCVIAGLGPAGTAEAAGASGTALPAALTSNRIYQPSTAGTMYCPVPGISPGSAVSVERFQQALAWCADRFWAARFAAAGLRYTPPKLEITTGSRSTCGKITANGAHYCPQQRTVAIRIMKRDLRDQFKMNLAHSVAHEWGHHVQELTGILEAQNTLYWRSGETRRAALSRRLEMQAECFAGVFYRSAFPWLDSDLTWGQWINGVRQSGESEVHGKPGNLAYWQGRGYDAGSASACNTWTAPNSRVA